MIDPKPIVNPRFSAYPNEFVGAQYKGIDIRTYIATAALQGLLEIGTDIEGVTIDTVASDAVRFADALIEELNKGDAK